MTMRLSDAQAALDKAIREARLACVAKLEEAAKNMELGTMNEALTTEDAKPVLAKAREWRHAAKYLAALENPQGETR